MAKSAHQLCAAYKFVALRINAHRKWELNHHTASTTRPSRNLLAHMLEIGGSGGRLFAASIRSFELLKYQIPFDLIKKRTSVK